ncbi:MAG TPA: ATP-binding protein [Planctomycetota bacterium]|jgi:PAS domain S-box-containing protein
MEGSKPLITSEKHFQLLVETVRDYAIFMLDTDGNVVSWNVGAERIKGYRRDEILGKNFSTFYLPEDLASGKPQNELKVAAEVGRFEDEGWRLRKGGTRFWASVIITALHDPSGSLIGFAKVTRDLTERKEAEEALRRANVDLEARVAERTTQLERTIHQMEEVSRERDEWISVLSHELRTPLTPILGWTSLLRAAPGDLENVSRGLAVIDRNVRAQIHLIEDLLDVSRIITGRLQLDMRAIELRPIIEAAIASVRPAADAKSIPIHTTYEGDVGPIIGDAERLQQVVWNLASNAVKFTPRHGQVEVDLSRAGSLVRLTVHDTGQGMDADLLTRIFSRFRQGDSSTTRAFGGLGMGLAIARHIVELHGGVVRAESGGLGKGATFSVLLPVQALRESHSQGSLPSGAAAHDGAQKDQRLDGQTILVVEDEPDTLELIAYALSRFGARVLKASSVAAAMKIIRGDPINILIADLGMPDADGYSLIRQVRSLGQPNANVPAIALTAYAQDIDREKVLRAGFQLHLSKPIEPEQLAAHILKLTGPAIHA